MIDTPSQGSAPRTKLLLVENDAGVRRSLQLLLHGRGYEVRAYSTGHQILADPRLSEAACLIADYRLDDMDGLAVLRDLRARGWQQPAILITAHGTTRLAEAAKAAGFAAVLEKPLQDDTLFETLHRTTRPH